MSKLGRGGGRREVREEGTETVGSTYAYGVDAVACN